MPDILQGMYPAHVSYSKMVCKSLVDVVRRGGRSLSDITVEIERFAHGRYELQHKQYLALATLMRHHTKNSKQLVKVSNDDLNAKVKPFGKFSDLKGYHGSTIGLKFLIDLMVDEYGEQEDYLQALQKGVFGRFWRCDHTRSVAKKVESRTGAMWSFSIMNEVWQIVSWVLVEGDGEKC